MNKKTYQRAVFPDDVSKKDLISGIVDKLDELKIINEDHYLESLFHYYEKSLFSLRKIKNKLFQKGFDQKLIEEFISEKLNENSDLELNILKKSGSWFSYGETRLGQGRDSIKNLLLDNPELCEELEEKIKSALDTSDTTKVLQD